MSVMHDFQDGKGQVQAHRHKNGGGWVSDDSYVDDDCVVSETSTVSDGSTVRGGSIVRDGSTVRGGSIVRDWSTVSDGSIVRDGSTVRGGSTVSDWNKPYCPPRMQIGRWSANQVSADEMRIGCVFFKRKDWTPEFIACLAKQHRATDAEIIMAVSFVLCVRRLEGLDK